MEGDTRRATTGRGVAIDGDDMPGVMTSIVRAQLCDRSATEEVRKGQKSEVFGRKKGGSEKR